MIKSTNYCIIIEQFMYNLVFWSVAQFGFPGFVFLNKTRDFFEIMRLFCCSCFITNNTPIMNTGPVAGPC